MTSQHGVSRRNFLRNSSLLTLSFGSNIDTRTLADNRRDLHAASIDGNTVQLFTPKVKDPVRIIMASDTHLWMDDERGVPYQPYSARMAKAYNVTKHFQTKESTNPNASFERIIALTKEQKVDLLTLPGDLFSFPSEAAIEWVIKQLHSLSIPFQYTAGNHDWHYEGMEGSLQKLRQEWCEKRLKPLYQGQSYLMSSIDIKGIRVLCFDNSTNEILPEQLAFLRQQIASKVPLLIFAHIPFYVPGRSMGFGCGHPQWGWDTDRGYEIERRERWPKAGHTPTTFAFCKELFQANSILGVFAGHTHRSSTDTYNGLPQVVAEANATGAYLDIQVVPL